MLENIKYKFDWMRTYNSPFKLPIPKLYIGKIAIGTPYFLPRKWVKGTPKLIHKVTLSYIDNRKIFNERNPDYAKTIKSYEEIYEEKKGYNYAIPKWIGFDFVTLGWKTKYEDYRHEWNPMWSFVFFKWQIAITFIAPHDMHYWECWLYYTRDTDKTKTVQERIIEAKKQYPCTWISSNNGVEIEICYWDLILKKKYL